jgi:hypothetical protein
MKNIIVFLALLSITACNDGFLEVKPKDLQTTETAFKSYDNFKTYAWGLYSIFLGYSSNTALGDQTNDVLGGVMVNYSSPSDAGNPFAYQLITETTAGYSDNWNFSYIRKVNSMLDNVDKSEMTETEKNHWRSVGLFFRSYRYFQLLSKFGDVNWIEHALAESDTTQIYGERTPRDIVAANLLRDLKYAENNIKVNGDGANTINVHVVRALISRFTLFEGTWRKYHHLQDANTYLRACTEASEPLLKSFPQIMDNFDEVTNSEDLSGKSGIILYKSYVLGQLTHMLTRFARSSGCPLDLTKKSVESYLCTDGKTISNSPLYAGDKTPNAEFKNRDRRLLFTVIPPHRYYTTKYADNFFVGGRFLSTTDTIALGPTVNGKFTTFRKVTVKDSLEAREYIDLMAQISRPNQKTLPLRSWDGASYNFFSPRLRTFNFGWGPFSSQLGYQAYKYSSQIVNNVVSPATDCPLFRIEEVMLNYAEAKFELGEFNQSVADQTLNVIRPRAGVAKMVINEITETFDPKRDSDVQSVLWEIRRERSTEFMGEGFAWDDIRRWKKGHYLDVKPLGMWVKNVDYNNSVKINGYSSVSASKDKEGYIDFFLAPKGWLEHYYLYPLPLKDLTLNKKLVQNPGWKSN